MASTHELKTVQFLLRKLDRVVNELVKKSTKGLRRVGNTGELEKVVGDLNHAIRSKAGNFHFMFTGSEWELASEAERKGTGAVLKVPYYLPKLDSSDRTHVGYIPVKLEKMRDPNRSAMFGLVARHERSEATFSENVLGEDYKFRKDRAQISGIFEMARYIRGHGMGVRGAEGVGIPVVIETDHFAQMITALRGVQSVVDGPHKMIVAWEDEGRTKSLLLKHIDQRLTYLRLRNLLDVPRSDFDQKEVMALKNLKRNLITREVRSPEELHESLYRRVGNVDDPELKKTMLRIELARKRLEAAEDAALDSVNPDDKAIRRAEDILREFEDTYDRLAPDVLKDFREEFFADTNRVVLKWVKAP